MKWIDQLLRDTLHDRAAPPPATACLDAETAAALADGALSGRERARAEAHAADCARCQAVLAAIVATTPADAVPPWWRRPAIAWLVPAAVAATAFVVWVNVSRRPEVTPALESARSTAPAVPRSEEPVPVPAQERDRRVAADEAPAATRADAFRDERLTTSVAEPQAQLAAEAPMAEARRAEAPLPSTTVPNAANALEPVPSLAAESARAAPGEPAADFSISETVAGTEVREQSVMRQLDGIPVATIVSSNPISRWRIGPPGVVSHSGDAGATWQTYSTGVDARPTAGSSPSPAVCWLVGPDGLVLISTDEGRSWQRVPFPAAVDLVSIRATDDRTATVITADRRTFTTADRGRTWK